MSARGATWSAALAGALALGSAHAQAQQPRAPLVQPSGPAVPANLLRLSIRFAAPIEGRVLERLTLRRGDGSEIALPFLAQELWSADGLVLTVLMHPGRVKTGLIAQETLGPILAAGEQVTLALDGHALKRWRVAAADEAGPQPSAWTLSPVVAGSRKPLAVALDAPIDGRDTDYLAVADARGRRLAGRARLAAGESTWTFTPAAPWRAGTHTLVVRGTLEDPAGNRLGSRFETPVAARSKPPADAAIPFVVGTGAPSP